MNTRCLDRSRSIRAVILVAVVLVAWQGPAVGQEVEPPPMAPDAALTVTVTGDEPFGEGFGTDDLDICTIGFAEFVPFDGDDNYITVTGSIGERYPTSGGSYLAANLDCVPNGAQIRQVGFYGRDSSTSQDLTGYLIVYYRESNLGTTYGGTTISTCSTSQSPGATACFMTIDHTVRRRDLWDNDGLVDVASYQVWALMPLADAGKTRISMVRILWRRQIRPAPVSPTFSDVPLGSFGFQHVEALVASGITAGCGGGNFCPNAPLTRVQMAIFLSKALGLHWPSGLSF